MASANQSASKIFGKASRPVTRLLVRYVTPLRQELLVMVSYVCFPDKTANILAPVWCCRGDDASHQDPWGSQFSCCSLVRQCLVAGHFMR